MWILGLKGLNKNPIGNAENLTNTAAFNRVKTVLLSILSF